MWTAEREDVECQSNNDAFSIQNQAAHGGSVVKNMPAKQETQVPSLGQEDTLEQEMATHSNILAWENPWTEELNGLLSMGS